MLQADWAKRDAYTWLYGSEAEELVYCTAILSQRVMNQLPRDPTLA